MPPFAGSPPPGMMPPGAPPFPPGVRPPFPPPFLPPGMAPPGMPGFPPPPGAGLPIPPIPGASMSPPPGLPAPPGMPSTPIPPPSNAIPPPNHLQNPSSSPPPPLMLPDPTMAQVNPPFKKGTILKWADANFSPVSDDAYGWCTNEANILCRKRRGQGPLVTTLLSPLTDQCPVFHPRRCAARSERALRISCRSDARRWVWGAIAEEVRHRRNNTKRLRGERADASPVRPSKPCFSYLHHLYSWLLSSHDAVRLSTIPESEVDGYIRYEITVFSMLHCFPRSLQYI